MKPLDVFPLQISAFVTDTRHLSFGERAAYLFLLMAMRSDGGWIADDDKRIATRLGITSVAWKKMAPAVRQMLVARDGRLSQGRMLRDIEAASMLENEHRRCSESNSKTVNEKKPNKTTNGPYLFSEMASGDSDSKKEDISRNRESDSGGQGGKAGVTGEARWGANRAKDDWPADYRERFWERYPRRTEKKAAMAKLDAVRKSGKVPWGTLIGGVDRYAEHVAKTQTEDRYVKHPATWLNRGCWDDEHGGGGGGENRTGGGEDLGFAGIAARIRTAARARGDARADPRPGGGQANTGGVVVSLEGRR